MIKKIDNLINQIDETCSSIIVEDYEGFRENAKSFLCTYKDSLSKIVALYGNPEMIDYIADASYWLEQYKRINEVLNGDDIFHIVDVLGYETKENLKELNSILSNKGIG